MMRTVAIYFSDLTEEAQQEVMQAAGVHDPKEANWDMDIVPLATVDFENEDDEEEDHE